MLLLFIVDYCIFMEYGKYIFRKLRTVFWYDRNLNWVRQYFYLVLKMFIFWNLEHLRVFRIGHIFQKFIFRWYCILRFLVLSDNIVWMKNILRPNKFFYCANVGKHTFVHVFFDLNVHGNLENFGEICYFDL